MTPRLAAPKTSRRRGGQPCHHVLNCQYAAGPGRTQATMAPTNKYLAQSNKSCGARFVDLPMRSTKGTDGGVSLLFPLKTCHGSVCGRSAPVLQYARPGEPRATMAAKNKCLAQTNKCP